MKLQKTLFKKYLKLIMLIVLLSFLILGMLLWIFVSKYWKAEKEELLTNNAIAISTVVAQNSMATLNNGLTIENKDLIENFIYTFSVNINCDIFITDTKGNVLLSSKYDTENYYGKTVPETIIDKAITGDYIGTVNFGDFYKNKSFVVGVPVMINGKVIALVFTVVDSHFLNDFMWDIFKIFIFAVVVACLLALISIGIFCYNMVQPLRQMSSLAHSFGKGDFSRRVPVKSSDELGQLAIAFNSMADSLSASEETRRSFIANVSHELKTPMTTIAGFIDGILDGTIPNEKQNYYLKIVSDEVKRLSRLVSSMLNLSRIDRENLKVNRTSFDLLNVVVNILLSFEKSINEKNINILGLDGSRSVFVYGDADMMYQVLYNLIDNAIKFVNKDGYIKISLEEKNNLAVFNIRNSGSGINSNDIGKIFDRFYKTDKSRSHDKKGMGLGLYIVKKLIRIHGGDIKVESVSNEYTEFEFFIPVSNDIE